MYVFVIMVYEFGKCAMYIKYKLSKKNGESFATLTYEVTRRWLDR